MDFSFSYFEDEVRDGFFIPSIMKINWAVEINIYETLCRFCDKYGLKVFATWGSLLGAIRHGGFIPWDDDIDVEMLRGDYIKLKKERDQENSDRYRVNGYTEDQMFASVVKFSDYRQLFVDPDQRKERHGFPFVSVMDIFIVDYVPFNESEREKYEKIVKNAMILEYSEKQKLYIDEMQEWLGISYNEEEPKWLQLARGIDEFFVGYSDKECREQTFVRHWLLNNKQYIFPNSFREDFIEVPFETGTMRVPIGYDSILRHAYGNFMNTVRVYDNHNYPWYQVLEERFEKKYQQSPLLCYKYEAETVRENCAQKKVKMTLVEELLESVEILLEAHRFVIDGIDRGENLSSVLDILAQCQTMAVSIGNRIEEKAVEGENAVHRLEEYCDVVFSIYEDLFSFLGNNEDLDIEQSIPEDVRKRVAILADYGHAIQGDIYRLQEKKEIVFLPYKAEHWKSLHTLWEKYSGEKDKIVTVIPVPYYYRDSEFNPAGGLHVEMDGYPEGVTLTSYEEYNFEVHHPDVVIYQFPYDEYSYALTLHPFFYASNLRKYVEKMVFIPPFMLREIEAEDKRSRYTLGCFVRNPGLIYADEIIVQSEQMKQVYMELLEDFTGQAAEENDACQVEKIDNDVCFDERIDWESKIVGTGFPLLEWEKRKRELFKDQATQKIYTKDGQVTEKTLYDDVTEVPSEWMNKILRKDSGFRKIILYYVSGSMMLEYGEKAIQKIDRVLDVSREHSEDMIFLWHTDPYAEKILRTRIPDVWFSYCELLERFRKEDIGILDDGRDYHVAVNLCDAFYGDGGTIMNECRMQKKPILWENPDVMV